MKLAAHDFKMTLEPERGGLISALTWSGADGKSHALLRRKIAAPEGRPVPFGLWPMVPFANRAFGAHLRHGGQDFPLPVNDPDTGSTIHGFGWQAPWDVTHRSETRAILRHRRDAGEDPYRYVAQLSISLVPGTVAIALSVVNEAEEALPYGLGLHPWFVCSPATNLTMSCAGALELGPDYRATGHHVLADGGPYAGGRRFRSETETAHSFTGWTGEALLESPDIGLGLHIKASDNLNAPVVWAPGGADFCCIEPQSHGIGAPSEDIAGQITPLTLLQPQAVMSGWLRLTPRILA